MTITLFVLAALAMRFLPHAWNFTPLAAVLLLVGARLRPAQWWMALAAVIASDLVLNARVYHVALGPEQVLVWAVYPLLFGMSYAALRGPVRPARLVGASLAASTLFFLVTNYGVWSFGGFYPHTMAGLTECFTLALPFFRNTLAGDLIYTVAFFSLYAWFENRRPVTAQAA